MELDFYVGFIETANQKSIAKASERLHITHPALSKQIRKIEQYYGVSLLKRSSKGVELTEAGHLLYQRIQPVLAQLTAIQSDITQLSGLTKLTLGALPSVAAHYLPAKILAVESSGVAVDVVVRYTSSDLLGQLNAGTIDAAIMEQTSAHKSYWSRVLFSEPLFAVVPEPHPFFRRQSIPLAELSGEPLILNPPECSVRKRLTAVMQERQLAPYIKTEVDFGEFILGYVAAGAGITVVPKLIADHVSHLQLKGIPIEDDGLRRIVVLVAGSQTTGRYLAPFFA